MPLVDCDNTVCIAVKSLNDQLCVEVLQVEPMSIDGEHLLDISPSDLLDRALPVRLLIGQGSEGTRSREIVASLQLLTDRLRG